MYKYVLIHTYVRTMYLHVRIIYISEKNRRRTTPIGLFDLTTIPRIHGGPQNSSHAGGSSLLSCKLDTCICTCWWVLLMYAYAGGSFPSRESSSRAVGSSSSQFPHSPSLLVPYACISTHNLWGLPFPSCGDQSNNCLIPNNSFQTTV